MWQDSRAADGHRFLQCGTPAQAGGNDKDLQANGQTPSRRLQECTGPEMQEIEATENFYRAAEKRPINDEDQDDHMD